MTIRLRNSSSLVKKKNTRYDNSSHIAKPNHNTCLLLEQPQILHILVRVWSQFQNIFGCSLFGLHELTGTRDVILHIHRA